MKALNRKLLRDLRLMWNQVLTIALVVASGVAGFITSFSAYDALSWSRDLYYAEARFADVFARLKRAPLSLERQLAQLPGAAHVQTTVEQLVQIDIPGVTDPMIGRLIGLDPMQPPALNQVHLRSGRMIQSHKQGELETLISEGFAVARQLKLGDRIQALINGKQETLLIVGIALSPEYIFAGLAGSPDVRGFGIFWLDRHALATAYDMQGAFNQVAVRLAPQAKEGPLIEELDRLLAPYGGASAHGRETQISHMLLNSEIQEQRVLGTVLPSIFLAVAAFLLNVVLSRQIATQREQIAALKALGYSNWHLGSHYLQFVMIIVLIGVVIGLGCGAWLGNWFTGIYADFFRFPELRYRVRPELILTAIGASVLAAVLATWHAIERTVKLPPAQAMRPPAPAVYQPSFIEAWGLRHWFSPAVRMILRTMQRRAIHTALTVLGIAISISIVITGSFWNDTIDLMLGTQFQRVMRGDVSVSLIEASPASVVEEAARLPNVVAVEAARSLVVRLRHGHRYWRGTVQGRPAQPELHRILDIYQRSFVPPQSGLLLTDRLADRLGVRVGDTLRLEVLEGRRQVLELPVVGTVVEMMGMNAYIERRTLNRLLGEGDLVNQLSLTVPHSHESELLTELKSLPRVAAAFSKGVALRNMEDVTARNLLVFSAILTLFAVIIAVGVVYNHARIALAERAWELASLRVMGFTRGEVSALLLGELALEIVMALPLGMFGGWLLSNVIVQLIKTDEFFFPLVILPATYAYAALCVVGAGLISAMIVRRRIDRLDLVGVLKTRE